MTAVALNCYRKVHNASLYFVKNTHICDNLAKKQLKKQMHGLEILDIGLYHEVLPWKDVKVTMVTWTWESGILVWYLTRRQRPCIGEKVILLKRKTR